MAFIEPMHRNKPIITYLLTWQPGCRDDDLPRRAVREQGYYPRPHGRGDRVEGRLRLSVHHAGHRRQYIPWRLRGRDHPVCLHSQGEVHPDYLIVWTSHGPVRVLQLLSPAAGQVHVPVCQAHGPDSRGESRLHSHETTRNPFFLDLWWRCGDLSRLYIG